MSYCIAAITALSSPCAVATALCKRTAGTVSGGDIQFIKTDL